MGTVITRPAANRFRRDRNVLAGRQGQPTTSTCTTPTACRPRADLRERRPFQTKVDHIYAVGDVIGFPPWPRRRWSRGGWLPTTPSGRTNPTESPNFRADRYLFDSAPYVGATEVELTKSPIPYEVGGPYRELARGQIAEDSTAYQAAAGFTEDPLPGVHISYQRHRERCTSGRL